MLPDPKDKIEEQNLLHLAMMASEDDREAEARASLEKVLQLDPKSPTALRQLGELELKGWGLCCSGAAFEDRSRSAPGRRDCRVLRRSGLGENA